MKTATALALAAMVMVLGATPLYPAQAQTAGVTRFDLQRHDISIPGYEAIQVRVDFAPGAVAAPHTHPGEEIIYVLTGTLEYRIEGRPPMTLTAGGVAFIPKGTIHSAKNVGRGTASELATYVVEKGKPLVIPAP